MARSGGLLSGGGGSPLDLYGDLFTDEQKAALQQRELSHGLLSFAAKLGAASAPSREPKGSFLGLLGQAAGGFASQGDEQALKGMEIAEKVRSARQERAVLAKVTPIVEAITRQLIRGGVPAAQAAQIAPQIATQVAAPQGGALANNAPASAEPDFSGIAGPPAWSSAGTALGPIPPAPPAGRVTSADYGVPPSSPPATAPDQIGGGLRYQPGGASWNPPVPVTGNTPPGPQSSRLLPPPPGANPQMGGGLLAGLPFSMAAGQTPGPGELPDLGQIQVELLSGETRPAGDDWQRVKPLIRKYESGGRNIEQGVVGPQGGYNPSVGRVTGPSSASGYYQMIDPTWRAAAAKVGIDTAKYPRAINAPEELQDKAAEALYREQGLRPWAPYNRNLAAATGYQGGLPDVGGVRVEPLGGEAAAAGSGGIAGTGVTPESLAALNAMLKLGGIKSDPFGSLLESYYKSSPYLREKATTEAQASKDVGLVMDPKIAAATAAAQQKYIQENATHESGLKLANDLIGKGVYLNKDTKRFEPITNAAQALAEIDRVKEENKANLELVDTTLTFPGEGRPRKLQMTRAQAVAVAQGKPVPELGIPAMTGVKMGQPVYNPTETALGPIEAKAIFDNHQLASDAATTIETNKQARALLDAGTITGFGADKVTALTKLGNALGVTGRDSQEQVANTEAYLATTAANVGRMIKQFGAGTGLSDADRDYAAQMAAGKITLDETSIRKILDINDRASLNIINRHNQRVSKIAPGATMTDLSVPVPESYKPPEKPAATTAPATGAPIDKATFDALPRGSVFIAPDGSRRIKP